MFVSIFSLPFMIGEEGKEGITVLTFLPWAETGYQVPSP
jgi:hypothetical protein